MKKKWRKKTRNICSVLLFSFCWLRLVGMRSVSFVWNISSWYNWVERLHQSIAKRTFPSKLKRYHCGWRNAKTKPSIRLDRLFILAATGLHYYYSYSFWCLFTSAKLGLVCGFWFSHNSVRMLIVFGSAQPYKVICTCVSAFRSYSHLTHICVECAYVLLLLLLL